MILTSDLRWHVLVWVLQCRWCVVLVVGVGSGVVFSLVFFCSGRFRFHHHHKVAFKEKKWALLHSFSL